MDKSFDEFIKLSSIEYFNKQKDYSSLYKLLQKCRINGYYHIGYYVGKILEKVGDYKYLDELSICAYWVGEYQEAYDLCKRLIFMCPDEEKDRIIQNKHFNAQKLGIKEVYDLNEFKKESKNEISKLPYKKYFYQYNDKEKQGLALEMKDIEHYFKKELDLDVYPVYGTLLGMLREKDFIGHDTDVDMAYMSKFHKEKDVLDEFNRICKFLEEKKLLFYRIKTASHLHVWSPSKHLRIDLWISWIGEDENYYLAWTIDGEFKKEDILPFKIVEFKGLNFPLINNYEKYLKFMYNDWQNPKSENWAARKPVFRLESWHGK